LRNPFPVTNLRPEVELMHLLHTRRHNRHKSRRKRCRAPKMTASLWENGCAEFKILRMFGTHVVRQIPCSLERYLVKNTLFTFYQRLS